MRTLCDAYHEEFESHWRSILDIFITSIITIIIVTVTVTVIVIVIVIKLSAMSKNFSSESKFLTFQCLAQALLIIKISLEGNLLKENRREVFHPQVSNS